MGEACLFIYGGNPVGRHTLSRSSPTRPSLPYRPNFITMAHNQPYWASINADIEAHLKQAIPIKQPLPVFEPMNHLAFARRRNTAPALCITACELVGGHRDQAISAASALYLMHAAAYVHEHLPLTDRSMPITNHVYSPNIELLMGDGIFPFGYQLLAESDTDDPTRNNSDRVLRVIVEISRAMGTEGMVDGQYHENRIIRSDGEELLDMDLINHVCEKKEGGLHACGAACGGILGGGSEVEIERVRKYGFYVGMIQGMLSFGFGMREKDLEKRLKELKNLALKELEGFKGEKVEAISSFLEN